MSYWLPGFAISELAPTVSDGADGENVTAETASSQTPDEQELTAIVRRAQTGDAVAQTELVGRFRKRVSGLVRRIVMSPCAVEDVVQSVMIKMLRRLPQLRRPEVFEHWLLTLARNGALDFLRRRKRQPVTVFDEAALQSAAMPCWKVTEGEVMAALERALARLNARDRRLVRMVVRGNSYRAIAASEGISEASVKIRLHRVRPFLRGSVGAEIGIEAKAPKAARPPCAE